MDKIESLIENVNANSVSNTGFVSLEKPAIEQKDTLDLIGDKAKDIGTGILDFGKSMIGTGADMIEDTARATVNLAENIYNGNLGLDYYFNKDQKKREWSDDELKQAEKLNTLSGSDMALDMLGMGGDYIKEKILGNEVTNNLKIDKDTFDSNISYIQKGIDEINGKIGSIQSGNNFKTFNDTTYQKYLKEKGISKIQDQSDYDLYVRTELARLDGITQSKILSEQNDYIKQTAELDFQRKQKEEELKTFLNENIKTDGIKTGEDIYNDYLNKQTEDIKNRSYIEALSELGNISKQQVEDALEAKGLAKNSTYAGYDKLKDTLIEDVTAENQYMLSIKGMKDLPDYDKLADQARDIRDVSFKFKTDVVKKFLDIRGLDENKGLSEVEVKNKALKLSWDEMSLQDKQVYKSKESFVTSVSALKNITQAKERASNLNPLSIIDIVGYATDKVQSVIDKAYDFDSSELPHFVKQDTRSLVYSGEGLAKNIGTALTYNPDAIISILGTSILGDKGISKVGNGLKLLSKITKADKIIELPATIGYGVGGTYKFVGSTIKNLSSSQLYGTIGDTVIDNVTVTAPTKASEEFNIISNLLFDTTPFLYKEAKSGIEYSTSANRIAYEFLHGDEKKAIKQFADTNLKGDIGKSKVILDEGIRKLYSTTYNPKEYTNLLTEKGALYTFVGDQLKGLEKDKLDAVLTSKGIGVQINYPEVFGLSREKQLDINDSFEKSINKNTVEGQINRVKYNNILDITSNSLKAGGDGIGFTILKSRINSNPDLYSKLTKNIKDDIKIMKDTYDKEVFIETNERLKDNMKKLQSEFSNTTLEKRITLKNSFTGDNLELNVNELESWGEKNIYDLAKEGKVKFTKGIYKGKEYNFLSKEEVTLDNHLEKFLDGKTSIIEEKEKELLLNQGIEGYAKGNDIKGIIKKFISGTTTTLKLSWIKDEEMSKNIAKITNDILSEYLNKDNVILKSEPIYINEKLPLNKETNMAKGEDILEYMKNDDSYINISYGNFISQQGSNKGENVYIMYFMPGKKLLDNKILGKYLNGIGTSGEINAGVVRNQGNKIVSDILKFALNKRGNLDIEQGITRTIAELSAGSLGFFIDGKLNKLAVKESVHEAIKSSLQKDVDTKVIADFILGAVKDFDEGQELLIEPIIYTLTNKYLNNKSLIDDVIIKAGKKEIDDKIEKVFADILLSPQVADSIAKNIVDKGRYIPDKYKIDIAELDKKAEDKIQVYISRLELRRKKLEIDLNELKEFKSNAGNSQGVENIDSQISIIESRIKAIDKDIRYKSSLESKEKQKMILNEIKEFIRGKSMDASKQILGTSLDYLNKELGTPVVQTVKENYKVAKDWIKDFKKDKTLNQDKILEVLGKLSDNAGDSETIKNIIEGIDDIGIKKTVNNFYNLTKNSNIVFNKQEINNLFYNDIIDGVSQYEFALQQNVLKKALKNLISNSNTDRNEVLEEKFIKHFIGEGQKEIEEVAKEVIVDKESMIIFSKEREDLFTNNKLLRHLSGGDYSMSIKELIKKADKILEELDYGLDQEIKKDIEEKILTDKIYKKYLSGLVLKGTADDMLNSIVGTIYPKIFGSNYKEITYLSGSNKNIGIDELRDLKGISKESIEYYKNNKKFVDDTIKYIFDFEKAVITPIWDKAMVGISMYGFEKTSHLKMNPGTLRSSLEEIKEYTNQKESIQDIINKKNILNEEIKVLQKDPNLNENIPGGLKNPVETKIEQIESKIYRLDNNIKLKKAIIEDESGAIKKNIERDKILFFSKGLIQKIGKGKSISIQDVINIGEKEIKDYDEKFIKYEYEQVEKLRNELGFNEKLKNSNIPLYTLSGFEETFFKEKILYKGKNLFSLYEKLNKYTKDEITDKNLYPFEGEEEKLQEYLKDKKNIDSYYKEYEENLRKIHLVQSDASAIYGGFMKLNPNDKTMFYGNNIGSFKDSIKTLKGKLNEIRELKMDEIIEPEIKQEIKKETNKSIIKKVNYTLEDIQNTTKFKEFKDSITVKEGSKDIILDAIKAKQNFDKVIEEVFKGVVVSARKDGAIVDISKELIDDIINDSKFFQNIKSISNKKLLKVGDGFTAAAVRKIGDEYKNQESLFEEVPIQFEMMKKNMGDRVQYLAGFNNEYINDSIELEYSLNKSIKGYKVDLNIEALQKGLQISPIEKTIEFMKQFNNGKSLLESIQPYADKGYAFVGGFGDKDSGMHLYKAPDSILDLMKDGEKNMGSEIYNIAEYAYSVGYIKLNREGFEDHDKFLKKFTSFLNKTHKDKIDRYELYEALQVFTQNKPYTISEYIDGKGYFPDGLTLNKDQIDFIKTIFKDKDTSLTVQELLGDILKSDKITNELKESFVKISNKGNIISLKDIRKRESFNTSVRNTFGEVKKPLDLIIIDELEIDVPIDYEKFSKLKFKDLTEKDISSLINELDKIKDDDYGIKESIQSLRDDNNNDLQFLKEVKTLLNNGFYNDMQDGTSFVSNGLLEMRGYLNGINMKGKTKHAYKQFKDHFFGEVDGVRVGGKTLFNGSVMKDMDGKEITNGVAIGKSSLKLGKDLYTRAKSKGQKVDITINGRKVSGYRIDGTDTSFFKNAGSDAFDFQPEVTFSDSIKASLSIAGQQAITKLQLGKIQDAFNKTLKGLLDTDISMSAQSNIDIAMLRYISENKLGYSSNSFIGSKIDEFMKEVDSIINKYKESGQSMFIYESNAKDIKPNEVIMSADSELVHTIRQEVISKRFGEDKKYIDLTEEEKLEVDDNLFTVGYRYPVPSTYNMGTYKIVLNTDKRFGEDNFYKNLGSEQVVPHPVATYMKLEGDNDGDHIFFISANSDIGKIAVEDINGVKYKGLLSYKNAFDEGRLKNKFLSLAQVDKDKAIESDGTINTLANSRIAALNAKAYISNVSATIRTIKNFGYMLSENKDGLIPISTGEFGFDYKAIKDIEDLQGLDIITDKRSFSAFAAQLLQDTLDFGNSGKSRFDTDRYNKLLGAAGIKPEIQDIVQAMYINPSAVSYKPKMERFNIPQIQKDVNKALPLKYQENSTKFLYNISGSKRELIEGLLNISHKFSDVERGELKLPEIIYALNKSHDFKFMLERFKDTMSQFEKGSEQHNRLKFIYDNFFSRKGSDSDYTPTSKKFIGHKKSEDGTKEYSNIYEVPTKDDLDKLGKNIYDIKYVRNKDTGKGGNTLSIKLGKENGKDKYKNLSIGAYEAMYVLFKDKPLTQTIEKYLTAKNKDKELIGKSLFKEILHMENQNERNIYSMMLLAGGEKKLVNILNEEEWHRFLTESDSSFKHREVSEGILLTDILKDIGGKLPEDEKGFEEIISEYKVNLDGINKKIEQLKADNKPEDKQLISQKEKIEDSIGILNEKLIEINALKETEGKYLDGLEKTEFKYENQKYNIPGFTESFIDIDDKGANYLLGESEGVIHRTRHNLTGKVSSWFEEYAPKFVGDYNIIRDELGLKNESMLKAYDNHHLHFNESQKNKSGIIYMLKNSGIKNYKDIQRDLQYALIDYQGGKYIKKSWDKAVKDIKSIIDYNSTTKELISDEENNFFAALKNYQEGTVGEVATILNSLEARGFKVNENYRGVTAKSLIIDTLESHKSDPQLTLRINGFKDRDSFETYVMNKIIESGRSDNFISRGTMRTMADTLYGSQGEWYDKILGFLKGVHYQMNYGTMSLVTGNGIMSGIAQMLPNYVELRSYLKTNINDIRIGYDVMKRTNILSSEGVLELGTGIGKDFNGDGFLDGTLDKAFQLAKGKNIQSSKAALVIHSVLTNPLGGTDYPIEALRKMVAITNTMKKLKIKDANELERKILLGGDKFEGFFKHRVMVEFASSGGGVNSSSALYKNTVFSSLHNYADIWGVRFLTQSMGYLMGWSYHKAATLIEKEASLYYGIKDLLKGNYQGAKYYIDDFLTYNTIIMKQATMALGIYMKMEKYEKDTNDDVTFEGFAKTFMNSVVSMSILLEKHLNSWESADQYGGTLSDKVGYTTVGFVRNLFRLFGQTAFISTMYKHYTYSQVEGKADLFNSLQFAMNEHYSGFIRYGLNDAVNSIYGGKGLDSKVGILGTGAKTETENMINDMINGNYFGMYKEKGFIKSMYDMFDGLLLKSVTSIPVGLQQQISKDLVELAMKDKEMSKLVNGGGFGVGSDNYNLENLFGKSGTELTVEQSEGVADIYKQFNDYNYNYLGKDGIKKDSFTQTTYDRMLQNQIDEALKKEGISMEDLIKKSVATPELLKTLVVLESKYGLKNPLIISMMIDKEFKDLVNKRKESNGRLTGEVSKYGTAYKDITEEDKMMIKRDLLVKYQDYFNLNRQIGMDIIAQDIKMNHKDKLEKVKNAVDKYGSSEKDMIDYLQKSFVIGQVAKEGDTSVSKLHSRYAVAAKGLAANETTVKIVNTFLNNLFQKEGLSHKEKLANAAGFLSGLDKATYGILSNNDEFNSLTEESRKVLMNWVYKTSSEAIDFDSDTLMNKMTSNSYGGNSSPYIRSVQPKYKSKSFEGNRPGFSKQFTPLQKYIPGREQYISKDSNDYIRRYNKPAEGIYSNLQSPTMVAYRNLLIEQLFYGYKSKGIITQKEVSKFDKQFKKDIKIAKAKKIKDTKPFVKPKQYKSYKQNLFANGPLTTYVQ